MEVFYLYFQKTELIRYYLHNFTNYLSLGCMKRRVHKEVYISPFYIWV